MPPDPRELVDRLDALAADQYPGMWHAHGTMVECYEAEQIGLLVARTELPQEAEFIAALHSAYPALRAAVLRCADLEAALVEWVEAQNELEAARPNFTEPQLVRVHSGYQRAKAALTAPQGEEQSRG